MLDRYIVKKTCLVVGLIIIELICVFFTIPLIRLLSVQVLNFFHGKTTNERFGRIGAGNQIMTVKKASHSSGIAGSQTNQTQENIYQSEQGDQKPFNERMESVGSQQEVGPEQDIKSVSNYNIPNRFIKTANSMDLVKKRGNSQCAIIFKNCKHMCCQKKVGLKGKRESHRDLFEQYRNNQKVQDWSQKIQQYIERDQIKDDESKASSYQNLLSFSRRKKRVRPEYDEID